MYIVGCTRQECRNGSDEKTSCERVSRTESITGRASNKTDEQSSQQSDNVRIADLICCQVEVFFDNVVEQRWEGVPEWLLVIEKTSRHGRFLRNQQVNLPRPEGYHESKPREKENATMDTDHIE